MKIPPGWDIPNAIRFQLGDRSGRQREIAEDGHLVLVLHRVPDSRADREAVYFWRTPDGEWRTSERGQPRPALSRLIAEYEQKVLTLEEQYTAGSSASSSFAVLEKLGPLNRAARNLHEALARAHSELDSHEARRELQDHSDHAADVARSCELLYHDARHSLDFHIAEQSEIQARHSREVEKATHRLNTMATVFLPLTAVASVFGMNLRSGLEDAPAYTFWLIMGLSVFAGLCISEVLAAWRVRGRHGPVGRRSQPGASRRI